MSIDEAELAMLAWESDLDDLPSPMNEIMLVEGELSNESFDRIVEWNKDRRLGGGKPDVLILDHVKYEFARNIMFTDSITRVKRGPSEIDPELMADIIWNLKRAQEFLDDNGKFSAMDFERRLFRVSKRIADALQSAESMSKNVDLPEYE
jgi:hypothetical protein